MLKRRILIPLSDEALNDLAHKAKEAGCDPREYAGRIMEESLITANTTDRAALLAEGKKHFEAIGHKVNALSHRTNDEYRREVDFEELCIALALHARHD